ncbi:hypothetical protein G6N73_31730 [Mesorhizobium camelthorni]|uniref:Fic/DOC N-terminal domain-containing protein n=1 Tax=Allomesorhizobium camelthorni TaxID=475069 RepID=A0A6G4WNB5_9HYPH|nr:hypothetical protein [Mesorhizobium camelthorni]
MGRTGRYVESVVGGEKVRAYVPSPLPPVPAVDAGQFLSLYDRARGAVGRLDGVTTILPSTPLFLFMYVRKEALLSSQIERLDHLAQLVGLQPRAQHPLPFPAFSVRF